MLSTVTGLGSVAVPVERGSWTSSSCLVCIAWIEVRAAVTCSSDIAMISPSMTDLCMSFEGRSLVRSSHNSLRSNDAKVGLLTVLLLEPDRECILFRRYAGLAKRAEPALLCSLGSGPSLTELRFPSSGPSLVEALLGSSVAEPSELGQGSAHSARSEEHTSELQSRPHLGYRLL